MSKATEDELAALHGAIARGLTDVITEGVSVVVGKGEDAVIEKVPASAAFFMAGIAMLKNNNITADAAGNADLQALNKALAERRRKSKGALLSRESVEEAADRLERDLGGAFE